MLCCKKLVEKESMQKKDNTLSPFLNTVHCLQERPKGS